MNDQPMSAAQLEHALAAKLRELLGQVDWLRSAKVVLYPVPDAGFDLLATVPLANGKEAALCVECKRELRPNLFRQLVERPDSPLHQPGVVVKVLALPWVSPRIAELCAENGWSWFDLAGNHRIDVPGWLHLERTGGQSVYSPPRPTANLSTPEAGRVVRALLAPQNAGKRWTQRKLAEHFRDLDDQTKPIPNTSLGLANKVVRYLREEGYVEDSAEGIHVNNPLKLLFAWRDVYRFDRHERRSYFTLLQGQRLRDAIRRFGYRKLAAYASFSAAEIQAPQVRQNKTWLFVDQQEISRLEEMVEAKPVDSGENIVVLIPDDEGVFYMSDAGMAADHLDCTNPVQTYVDVWHSGGRGQEAAEAVLAQCLKPQWQAKGLPL
jgi:hypothetical protein